MAQCSKQWQYVRLFLAIMPWGRQIFSNPHLTFAFYALIAISGFALLHLGIYRLGLHFRRYVSLKERQNLLHNAFPEFDYQPFAEVIDVPLLRAFPGFEVHFRSFIPTRLRVNRAEIYHLLTRERPDIRVSIFDLRTIQRGMEGSRSRASVTSAFLIEFVSCSIPTFSLSREGIANIALWGEDPDIDIDGEFVFSQNFYLTGPDKDAVRSLFDSSFVSFIRSHSDLFSNGLLETTDNALLFRYGQNLAPEQIQETLAVLLDMANIMKEKNH